VRRDFVGILFDNASRNSNVLGVCAVVKQQVFAQVFLVAKTIKTFSARSGVGGNNTLPHFELADIFSHRDDVPRQLVAEQRWWDNHAGVVAPAEHFNIGSAGESGADANQHIFGPDAGNGNRLYLQALSAVQNGCHHLMIHFVVLWG
jgi:hypothetical protein